MNVKLLKNLNFAAEINKSEAITEAGKDVLNKYRSYVYANPVTYGLVNGFINEATKFAFDAGLTNILESLNKFIKENNVSWKLASACESIQNNNSKFNYINKIGAQQVEKLLDMNESDVVSYIKAGSLKSVQYIPEFRQICKEVYKMNICEKKALNYVIVNPVSYIISEGETRYFQVLGKGYKIEEGNIVEAVIDNVEFAKINGLLENFVKKDGNLVLEYNSIYNEPAEFILTENEIKFEKANVKESFENVSTFNEYVNMVSKAMPIKEKMNFNKYAALVSTVFEHMDNIIELDNVKLIKSNYNVVAVLEGKDNVNVTVFNSINAPKTSKNYDFVVEALNDVIKVTGIDLKSMYEERIEEDCKKANTDEESIREQLEASKEEQFNIRKKKIAMLAEQFKNDPIKLTLLSKVAKDLAILEKQN